MARLIGRIFGVIGFTIPLLRQYVPLGDTARNFLWSFCLGCPNVTIWNDWRSRLILTLMFSLWNGALFAAIGFGLAKLWATIKPSAKRSPLNEQ